MANSQALNKPWALEPVLLFPYGPVCFPFTEGSFSYCCQVMSWPGTTSCLWRGSQAQRGCWLQQQWPAKGGRGCSSSKLGGGEDSPGRELWLTVPQLPPNVGRGRAREKCIPPSGRIKSPKGPLVKGRPPQAPSQRQQAKQFMRLGALKPGLLRSGRDLSSLPTWCWDSCLSPPRISTLTHSRPHGSHQLPAFPSASPPSIKHTMSPKCSLGARRDFLAPLLTCGGLRTEDPGCHHAQGMEALWSVPAVRGPPHRRPLLQVPWIPLPQARALLWLERWSSPCTTAWLILPLWPPPLPHPPPLSLS